MKSKKLISLGIMAAMLTGMVLTGCGTEPAGRGNNAGFHRKRQKQQNQHQQKYSSIR